MERNLPTDRELMLHCSFCGKTGREVWPIVEGPIDAAICHQCVDLCDNLMRRMKAESLGATCLFCSRTVAEVGSMTALIRNAHICIFCEDRLVKAVEAGWKLP
jgi:hypothetical protein